MSFNDAHLAKVSGFQNNCALNCILHAFCDHIVPQLDPKTGLIPEDFVEEDTGEASAMAGLAPQNAKILLNAFQTTYGLKDEDLDWAGLVDIINQTQNPVHREVLLGPVLRTLLDKEGSKPFTMLEDDKNLIELANGFNISLESYAAKDNKNNRLKEMEQWVGEGPTTTLKLKHNGVNHWSYEETNPFILKVHNRAFEGSEYAYYDHEKIKKSVREAIQGGKFDLTPVLASCHAAPAPAKGTSAGAGGTGGSSGGAFGSALGGFDMNAISAGIQKVSQVFSQIFSSFGGGSGSGSGGGSGKDNGFGNAMLGVFQNIMQAVMAFKVAAPMLENLFNTNPKPQNIAFTPAQLRDPKTARFNTALKKLGEIDPALKGAFIQEWTHNPKGREHAHWTRLVKSLTEHGLLNEAKALLKEREQEALKKFEGVGKSKPKPEKDGVDVDGADGSESDVDDDADDKAAKEDVDAVYRRELNALEAPELDYARRSYKRENLEVRLAMLNQYFDGKKRMASNQEMVEAAKEGGTPKDVKQYKELVANDKSGLRKALTALYDAHAGKMAFEREQVRIRAERAKVGGDDDKDDSLRALT